MSALKLYWDSVQGAIAYNVYWDNSPGVTTSSNAILGIKNVLYHHTGLVGGFTYYYIVVGVDIGNNLGPASIEFSAETSPDV